MNGSDSPPSNQCTYLGRTRQQLVEDVIVALVLLLIHNARLLEQVIADGAAARLPLHVKLYLEVLAEPRRVVIAQRLGVAECLQQRIALQAGR